MSKKAPLSEDDVNRATIPSNPSKIRFSNKKNKPNKNRLWLIQITERSPIENPNIVIVFAEIFLETNT